MPGNENPGRTETIIRVNDAENDATIALLTTWLQEVATDDPEELRKAEEELREFKRNINAPREETVMTGDLDRTRQVLTEQVLDSTTLEEVRGARRKLREWVAAHPEEREWMRDGFEQLAQMEEIAQAQDAERAAAV